MLYFNYQDKSCPISSGFRCTRKSIETIYGEAVKYLARDWQFECIQENSTWFIVPNTSAPNETCLNGKCIQKKTILSHNDEISVGREHKKKYFCRTTVQIRSSTATLYCQDQNQRMALYSGMEIENTPSWQQFFGPDAQYISIDQYTILHQKNRWVLKPNPNVQNETLLNGQKVEKNTILQSGDRIAVGNYDTGIEKCIAVFKDTAQPQKLWPKRGQN